MGPLANTAAPPQYIRYDNLAFPGVDTLPPSILDGVLPYDLHSLVPYEPHLLADWPAQLYNLDVEWIVSDAYDTMLVLSEQRAGPLVSIGLAPGLGTRVVRTSQVSGTTYQLVLLPLWVAWLESEEGHGLALANGQTGQAALGPVLR